MVSDGLPAEAIEAAARAFAEEFSYVPAGYVPSHEVIRCYLLAASTVIDCPAPHSPTWPHPGTCDCGGSGRLRIIPGDAT